MESWSTPVNTKLYVLNFLITKLGHKNSTGPNYRNTPIVLTSGLVCRTSGTLEPCKVCFFLLPYYHKIIE